MAGGTIAFGTIFKIGLANPPTTELLGVTDIAPPEFSRDAVDVTDHKSADGAMEFISDGVYDPGQLVVTMNHEKGSATDDACRDFFLNTPDCYVQWTENAASGSETLTSAAVVTNYASEQIGTKGKQVARLTVKLSGPLL
jgi:hypothetical protein